MTKEEELLYSEKYYKGAKKFGLFFSILIITFGIAIITVALILLINRQTKPIIIVSVSLVQIVSPPLPISAHNTLPARSAPHRLLPLLPTTVSTPLAR